MDAILSLIFITVLFGVIYPFAFHYWQQGNYRLAFRWGAASVICLILGVVFAGRYYLRSPSIVIKKLAPKGKAYIIVRESTVDPLNTGKGPIFSFWLQNTGSVEATGLVTNVSCWFSYLPSERSLTYNVSEPMSFKLAPMQETGFKFPFKACKLDDYQLKILNDKNAALYIFWKIEYSDETGNSYTPISCCRKYATDFPSRLAICDDDISFKEREPVNQ